MRLYLSSFRLGNRPEALLGLLRGRTRAAVITNADDCKKGADRTASFEREYRDLSSLGLEPAELDLRRFFGRPSELKERLGQFDLVWVRGGNPFILRRALRESGAEAVILGRLAADSIVYGGYSAGSCMMTPSLHGVELVDDPADVPEGYDEEIIWECLNILPYGILPHYMSDHPESPRIGEAVQFMIDNHLPFVALRDGEAIVRDGTQDLVVG